MHQTTGLVFSIHCDGYSCSSTYTLPTRELLVFLIQFSSNPEKGRGQVSNVGVSGEVVAFILDFWNLELI